MESKTFTACATGKVGQTTYQNVVVLMFINVQIWFMITVRENVYVWFRRLYNCLIPLQIYSSRKTLHIMVLFHIDTSLSLDSPTNEWSEWTIWFHIIPPGEHYIEASDEIYVFACNCDILYNHEQQRSPTEEEYAGFNDRLSEALLSQILM